MLLLLLSNKIHPRVSHWPRSAVLWPPQLFRPNFRATGSASPPPTGRRLLPPGTWGSKILELPPPPPTDFYHGPDVARAKPSRSQVLGPHKGHSGPGRWQWPPRSAGPPRCPCPRDTRGHKASSAFWVHWLFKCNGKVCKPNIVD